MHDRSDDEEPEQHRDEQREERRDNEVNDVGHEGLEPFLQARRKDTKHEGGQNRALITNHGNRNPEDLHRERDGIPRRNRVGVRQLRSDEHQTKHNADDGRSAEAVHRRPADECGQEGKCRIRQDLTHTQEIFVHLDAETLCHPAQPHEESRRHEHGNDGDKDIAEGA